ncbi:glucosaminidase domain-containing protein [Thalassotalea psychrophila]|uniref:Glucosaminidase domain-containing protein n=1 Tax=Thalassotalea psychrophila TaxID=3065647 RepID=A0ABY9TYC9_9GAMM|nr:glucosaminidase domain-containing protein [Colwelliaceae bacterium SQ149]
MRNNLKLISLSFLASSLLLSACSEPDKTKVIDEKFVIEAMKNPIDVEIHSLDELMALFKKHQYDSESWAKGSREVPRLSFEKVSEEWKHTSNDIPVQLKKEVFFRLMAPLVLISNERILLERQEIKSASLDNQTLKALAVKYSVLDNEQQTMTEELRSELLVKVDIMPPSLALAQAAEESGWGTSRFAEEGNAFFGQWDFSGKGMAPKQQRKELGDYGLARFDSPLGSVEGYMFNINTTTAYAKLRTLRAQLRESGDAITGMELAGTLDKYSERGQAYIDSIREMISYNKLQDVDEAYLSKDKLIHLTGN